MAMGPWFGSIVSFLIWITVVDAIPAEPFNFTQQVDHFNAGDARTFMQRYYKNETWFKGPGSPIFCIIGGEGSVPPETGIFYPFVTDVLAKRFGALVIEPEHRFYGTSQPYGSSASFTGEHLSLATPQQALADTAAFIKANQKDYGCTDRGTPGYCPVITVGGSYPGWLSAMMRMRYPAIVDAAYAASAPMKFYSQEVDSNAYYQKVTDAAERAVPGCADAVRGALAMLAGLSKDEAVTALNICEPLPPYLSEGDDDDANAQLFRDELNMVFMVTFADLNMANYPPSGSSLEAACSDMVATAASDPFGALSRLLSNYAMALGLQDGAKGEIRYSRQSRIRSLHGSRWPAPSSPSSPPCFNMSSQLPAGTSATISCGDWSGCGTGSDGEIWDYETCNFLVEQIGVNNATDMFPPRAWSLDWLEKHCTDRFGSAASPQPSALVDLWGFDSTGLAMSGATRILFTNGLQDGWSVGGITEDVGDTDAGLQLLAVNMENGAHHSDLAHTAPDADTDTPDVTEAREKIGDILAGWLGDLPY